MAFSDIVFAYVNSQSELAPVASRTLSSKGVLCIIDVMVAMNKLVHSSLYVHSFCIRAYRFTFISL